MRHRALESIRLTADWAGTDAIVRGLRTIAPKTSAEHLIDDAAFRREFERVRSAEQRHRTRGVDVLDAIEEPITHPFLKEWINLSNELVATTPGRSDLRRQRRRGVLRLLHGEAAGMPFDLPPAIALPPSPWRHAEWRTFRLKDEMEHFEMIFIPAEHPAVEMRPVVDVLSHRQARAMLDWPAATLDSWLSIAPHMLGGLRQIEITPEVRASLNKRAREKGNPITKPRRTLHRVAFETLPFMIWLASNRN
jgi:hypothetical protein